MQKANQPRPKLMGGQSLSQIVVMDPGNFTPESRTPWGGYAIAKLFKNHLSPDYLPMGVPPKIGESWEFSMDPSFPSRAIGDGASLEELTKRFPSEIFSSQAVAEGKAHCRILVKLLEAAEPLSLQVHPRDDDPDLKPHECGKPESWLVLVCEPGAGIYLGFNQPLTREKLKTILNDGDAAKSYLNFVEVKPGDYFEIEPGVPHAIGPGVTILEPQRVLPGKEGKTFRLWDWGRLYGGKPRELHIEQGLKLIDPTEQVGENFVETLRRQPTHRVGQNYEIAIYPPNDEYQAHLIRGQKGSCVPIALAQGGGFGVLTVLKGSVQVAPTGRPKGSQNLLTGMTALLPNAALPLSCQFAADGEFVLLIPSYTKLSL